MLRLLRFTCCSHQHSRIDNLGLYIYKIPPSIQCLPVVLEHAESGEIGILNDQEGKYTNQSKEYHLDWHHIPPTSQTIPNKPSWPVSYKVGVWSEFSFYFSFLIMNYISQKSWWPWCNMLLLRTHGPFSRIGAWHFMGQIWPCWWYHHKYFSFLVIFDDCISLFTYYSLLSYEQPFTNDFPWADIHKLLLPNILHQLIKGAFKNHLITWVHEYLVVTYGKTRANEILDNIDRSYILQHSCDKGHFLMLHFSIVIVPLFSGMWQFPEG
jgi:hypothetical protein